MRSRFAVVSLLASSILCGCEGDPAVIYTCEEGDLEASRRRAEWPNSRACSDDSDCVLVDADVSCADVKLGGCVRAVHRESTRAYAAFLAEIGRELCPQVEPGCASSGLCFAQVARCVAGRCESRDVLSDAGPRMDAGPRRCQEGVRCSCDPGIGTMQCWDGGPRCRCPARDAGAGDSGAVDSGADALVPPDAG